MQNLPEKFIQNVRSLIPLEAEHFFESINNEPATSIRLNPNKYTDKFNTCIDVPWASQAKFLDKRPSFIADPLFHAGAYYVQEASSMFIEHIIKHIKTKLNPNIKVLDLCAAPGGKTTLVSSLLNNDDLLVANEIIKSRVNTLEDNCIKWGRSNVVVSNNDPKDFTQLENYFDIIIIDAPCSGEGMFRKDKNAIQEWSEENVNICTMRQQRILNDVLPALKPGGFIVYSTCTFNTSENEENVQWMMNEYDLNSVEIPIKNDWNISTVNKFNDIELHAYRFYPHKVNSEGFFVACLQKASQLDFSTPKLRDVKFDKIPPATQLLINQWLNDSEDFKFIINQNVLYALPKTIANDMLFLRGNLKVHLSGLKVGEVINNKLIPNHQLALSIHLNQNVPSIDVSLIDALKFLKKDSFQAPQLPQNIYLITFNKIGLGWIKLMPNRMNNYLPTNWRILKDLKDLIES